MTKLIIALPLLAALTLSSCKEKVVKKDIIVPPPAQEAPKGTQQMSETHQSPNVEWLGSEYKIFIDRKADKGLPKVADENGIEYYDNAITLRIQRADGSDFINKTFSKEFFSRYLPNSDYTRNGALLGIVFDKVENDRLTFAASIGSPDVQSDEFIPLIMTINRMGEISVKQDTRMDTEQPGGGITGDEEA